MGTPPIVPCIWTGDRAEQAADFYVRTFPGGRILATSRYPASIDNPGGRPRGSVLTVEIELAGLAFTLLDGGPIFVPNPSVSFFVHVDSPGEADRLFGLLAVGGEPLMALGTYPWSERYGWVKDRYGVSWQVMAGRRPPSGATIVPCLMFTGAQHGKAEEALRWYAGIFPGGHLEAIERYAEGEGPTGTVKHGRVVLGGQELIAMDGHGDHGFTFDEGISLQILCGDQPEADRYWAALTEGGEEGQCGWLKDRFGLSWQVAPVEIIALMTGPDGPSRDRVFTALLKMKKLDLAALRRAAAGGQGP